MIEIDGSFGEGGGQILRTSLTFALLTGQAFHLRKVRARRARPGLQPQHLMSVKAAAAISGAKTRGADLRSTDLVFTPGKVRPGKYHFSIGTAGATGLVLHTIALPLALAGGAASDVNLGGGTHNEFSPCYHFNAVTWRAYLTLLGINVKLSMRRPGFYPRGGGVVEAQIEPAVSLRGLDLADRPHEVKGAEILSAVASLPDSIAQRQSRWARQRLESAGLACTVREESWPSGPGTMLAVTLATKPVPTLFFGLGARGRPAERVADEAVDQALAYLNAPGAVDSHSADQLLLPLCLAQGPSRFSVTQVTKHLLTNAAVIRHFLDRPIACEGEEDGPGWISVG